MWTHVEARAGEPGERSLAARALARGLNGARFGGDPSRIVVIGQSAGAVHVAGALFDPRLRPACYESIRATALMSGLYDIHPNVVGTVRTSFGSDESQYADSSSVRYVG
jgi:acetyl esterase/lipase